MKVGEFSELTGLPISTLHFYERKGFLSPARSDSGHRDYAEADLSWALFINRLRDTGMTLSKIKEYSDLRTMGETSLEARMEMLVEHRASVKERIGAWQDNARRLEEKIRFYEDAISKRNGGSSDSAPFS